ncbi:hydrolase [Thermodesulfobacterium sp. TA1]|uniref:hydrolase n=1 Tax=Thermodesulfobacterium sp. TA1 TaxID=2234087 RepID=UPI00123214E3|nr:hydrolase [Thermodesulfobacterium sp. TA1]QER41397.1 hydrolase [Thermodesulfobacterium sp. TA1]
MDWEKYFIRPEEAVLVIVDVQEKLVKAMEEKVVSKVIKNISILIEVAKGLGIPIMITEQYPKGLGPTIEEIKTVLPEYTSIEKITFDCCGEQRFLESLEAFGRRKVILTGMETHICVYQTALSLLNKGYCVFLPKDAVCSRREENWKTGLQLSILAGALPVDTETITFQLLQRAGTEEFKKLSVYFK